MAALGQLMTESTCVIMKRYRVHRGICLAATLLSQGHRWRIGVSRLPQTCSVLFSVHSSGVEISQVGRLVLPNDCDVAELKIYWGGNVKRKREEKKRGYMAKRIWLEWSQTCNTSRPTASSLYRWRSAKAVLSKCLKEQSTQYVCAVHKEKATNVNWITIDKSMRQFGGQ